MEPELEPSAPLSPTPTDPPPPPAEAGCEDDSQHLGSVSPEEEAPESSAVAPGDESAGEEAAEKAVEEVGTPPPAAPVKRKRGRPPKARGGGRAPASKRKEKEEEVVCFVCFDGGDLVVCDRGGCPKVYHPSCVNRDSDFFRLRGRWNCEAPPSPLPPIKSMMPMAAARSPAKAAPFDQIATPEKPILPPRRTRNRSMALSVKEVKNAALGLRRPVVRSDLDESVDDLLAVEKQLAPDSVSKPSKPKVVVKLPEKYEMLAEFFNCMECSIRLLRLKGSMSTFQNVRASIQHLTDRTFTYGHLAQLKHTLPEAILIKKVLILDEATCCMKPKLQVTLQVGAIEGSIKRKEESDHSLLRRLFRERLVDFSKEHPQGDDIPEDVLPHPFTQTKAGSSSSMERPPTSLTCVEPLSIALSHQQFSAPSHMFGSFSRRFSQKTPLPDGQKTALACLDKASAKDHQSVKSISKPPISKKSLLNSPMQVSLLGTSSTYEEKTRKSMRSDESSSEELNILGGTPAKLVATPARLMICTPDIQTPKRHRTTTDYDSPQPKKLEKRSIRTKLFTTPKKNKDSKQDETRSSLVHDNVIGFLPEELLQSIREKERKALEEREAGVDEAKRRQKLLSCLHNIFNTIMLVFQSGNRSTMTKQELIHKIVTCHFKIVDRAEVEDQLKLLEEIVPDWISEKVALSGDILICVNKMSSPEEIRQRLTEAE